MSPRDLSTLITQNLRHALEVAFSLLDKVKRSYLKYVIKSPVAAAIMKNIDIDEAVHISAMIKNKVLKGRDRDGDNIFEDKTFARMISNMAQ